MFEDSKEFIANWAGFLKLRNGKNISLMPKSFIFKDAKEQNVIEEYSSYEDIKNKTKYC